MMPILLLPFSDFIVIADDKSEDSSFAAGYGCAQNIFFIFACTKANTQKYLKMFIIVNVCMFLFFLSSHSKFTINRKFSHLS